VRKKHHCHIKLSHLFRALKTNARLPSINLSKNISTMGSTMKFVPRPSEARGHADHGWLKTFHTFSFASYYDGEHSKFGSLRVINEDRVDAGTGFGTHPHREFEIFSYIVNGAIEHKDSMGNTEILKRGDVQLTSAGTGISHSEKTYGSIPVHFLQIWSTPSTPKLAPKYYTRHFSDEEKQDKWARVVARFGTDGVSAEREGKGPAPVQTALTMYASLLSPSTTTKLEKKMEGTKGYVHVVQTSGYNVGKAAGARVKVSAGDDAEAVTLGEGDGAYIFVGSSGNVLHVENVGDSVAEVVLFDIES